MIYKGNFTSQLREGIPVLLHTATESIFLSSALHQDLCSQEMGPISFPALACPRDAPSAVLLVWLTLPVPIHIELHQTDMHAALSSAPRSVRLTDKVGCVGMLPLLFMFSYGVGYTSVRKTFQIGQNNWHNWLTIWLYHIFFWHFYQN